MNSSTRSFGLWQSTAGDEHFLWAVHTKLVQEAAARRDIAIDSIDDKAFFLQYGGKSVLFMEHQPELTSAASRAISHDKHTTKIFLDRAGVSTPKGNVFPAKEIEKGLAYAKSIGFPVVIKPIIGSGGKGVTSDIKDEEHFRNAWEGIGSNGRYIVEKHIYGNDYRVLVINGRFVCAAQRIPVNITGDGVSNVNQLIEKKNTKRSSNPYVGVKKVKLNNEMLRTLRNLGYDENSVIPTGQNIQLVPVANIGTGGDSKDVTDEVHPGFAEIAIKAAHSIPGTFFAGVDLLAPDISRSPEEQDYAICEINTRADIGLHNFPVIGQARDAAGALVQEIFPDAKPVSHDALKKVLIVLRGSVTQVGMRKHIQRLASLNHFHGWVKNEGEEVHALLCGSTTAIDRIVLSLAARPNTFLSLKPWNKEAPQGFKIIE